MKSEVCAVPTGIPLESLNVVVDVPPNVKGCVVSLPGNAPNESPIPVVVPPNDDVPVLSNAPDELPNPLVPLPKENVSVFPNTPTPDELFVPPNVDVLVLPNLLFPLPENADGNAVLVCVVKALLV